jgi:hypothetical protein
MTPKWEFMRPRVYDYLVELRDSGETNMWGAAPYLVRQFGLTHQEAGQILVDWIRSFDGANEVEEGRV